VSTAPGEPLYRANLFRAARTPFSFYNSLYLLTTSVPCVRGCERLSIRSIAQGAALERRCWGVIVEYMEELNDLLSSF
jgi:hypothetical protein